MAALVVATKAGAFLLREAGAGWTIERRYLEGCEVPGLARQPDGTVLAASRGSGLNRIDPESGGIERVATAELPDKVRAVTVSAHDPRRIYVGSEPAGIYVSDDGGAHFDALDSVARLNVDRHWTYPVKTVDTHIRHIVVDADDPNRLYAAVQVGGLIRSGDAGESWEVVDDVIDPDVHGILQHPARHDIIYAICGGGGGESEPPDYRSGRPIYRSDDRGETWRCVSGEFQRNYGAPLCIVPGDRPVLAAGIARGSPPNWIKRPERADAALVFSDDDGETWKNVTDGVTPGQRTMIEAIAVSPNGDRRLYFGTGGEGPPPPSEADWNAELYTATNVQGHWQSAQVRLPGITAILPL